MFPADVAKHVHQGFGAVPIAVFGSVGLLLTWWTAYLASDAGAVMGVARPGPAVRWASAQGLLVAALAASVLVGASRVRR